MAVFKAFHWSDNHNEYNPTNATKNLFNNLNDLDAVIHTGDIVNDNFDDPMTNSSPYDFLYTIGNHDMITAEGTTHNPYDWTMQPTQSELFNKFMVPTVVSQSAVIIPNTTWWYKDYPDKKVRIVGLNSCIRNTTDAELQMDMLDSCMLWCKDNDYAALVCMHITPYQAPLLVSNFTCKYMVDEGGFDDGTWQTGTNPIYPEIGAIYNALISWSEQVRIIALITGHHHGDGIGKSSGLVPFPIICVGSTRLDEYNDVIRTQSTPVANLYEYNNRSNSLIVTRLGGSCLVNGKSRVIAVWNYATHEWVQFLSR